MGIVLGSNRVVFGSVLTSFQVSPKYGQSDIFNRIGCFDTHVGEGGGVGYAMAPVLFRTWPRFCSWWDKNYDFFAWKSKNFLGLRCRSAQSIKIYNTNFDECHITWPKKLASPLSKCPLHACVLNQNKRFYGIPDTLGVISICQVFYLPIQKGSHSPWVNLVGQSCIAFLKLARSIPAQFHLSHI